MGSDPMDEKGGCMARKLRYKPENVCYHVVTRVAHRDFIFDSDVKSMIVKMIRQVEAFTGVNVLAYTVMSNHLHLLLFIDKPATLKDWEESGLFLNCDFDGQKHGEVYRIAGRFEFTPEEVDKIKRLRDMPVLERYEMTAGELKMRMCEVMRPQAYAALMASWEKKSAEELEAEYERQLVRMYDLSEFMKLLKQNITQWYNATHKHVGGLWEGRFKDAIIERSVKAMSSVAAYIDLNAWRANLVQDPAEYKWSSLWAAEEGDQARQRAYGFVYDTSADWRTVESAHRQLLQNRMETDSVKQGELEEAVFTSGGIVGSAEFVKQLVDGSEDAFPSGHKTPPVRTKFEGGDLKVLRNLQVLRKPSKG